ncbi:hypothetical protein GCM10022226_28950 [Sphaerisporangium flaviroseum]|uniref:TIGR02234 family membrane protein n=1 Tax=Sphaerisporangium flaviroseum TaxID=509199 RepID=A0ABP7I5L4_9ACTN
MTTAPNAPAVPPKGGTRRTLLWPAAAALGAVLALFASGRTWATVSFGGETPGARPAPVALAGGDIAPFLSPLALAALAAVVAVLATQGVWRKLIGVVIALFGGGIIVGAAQALVSGRTVSAATERTTVTGGDLATTSLTWAWPGAAAAGGLVLAVAGLVAVARGNRWPGMSDRYERTGSPGGEAGVPPKARAERPGQAERALWDALDRGVDPTEGRAGDAGRRAPHGADDHGGRDG